jgi:hypothetical protein
MKKVDREGRGSVSVSAIQLGQLWRSDETGDNWLVTKVYSEVFASYAVLRKVGGTDADLRRVKIEKSVQAATLPGFTFTQDFGSF